MGIEILEASCACLCPLPPLKLPRVESGHLKLLEGLHFISTVDVVFSDGPQEGTEGQ